MDLNSYSPGRPAKPETIEAMKEMLRIIGEEPGIRSAKVAKQVGLTSLRGATLGRRLAKMGHITITKRDGALTYRLTRKG